MISPKVNIDRCKWRAIDNRGRCLSRNYIHNNSKMHWQCADGHTWWAPWNQIRKGHWCQKCAAKRRGESLRLGIDYCNHIATERGCRCLSKQYIDVHTPIRWQCNTCGREWTARLTSIKEGSGCPYCHISAMENRCRTILETIFRKSFPKCKPFKHLDSLLELDGYCEELNVAFEYDGVQHRTGRLFKTHKYNPSIFERDRKKEQLCKQSDILLIRIADIEATPETLVDIIIKKLQEKEVLFYIPSQGMLTELRTPTNVLYKRQYEPPYLDRLRKACEKHSNPDNRRTGQLLDNLWVGSAHKYNIECEMGHHFKMQYNAIICSNEWCPACGRERSNSANISKRIGIERCRQFAKEHDGVCLSDKYANAISPMKWHCNRHNFDWIAEASRIVGGKTWCPKCGRERTNAANAKHLNT